MNKLHIFLILIIFIKTTFTTVTLQQVHVLFRHGERAPTSPYENDPHASHTWVGGWGELTNRGKLQMFNLGVYLRRRYKEFLPLYNPNDVKVLSSYADRCLNSAQVLLTGLFPPEGDQIWNKNLLWQPIPVSYKPRLEDEMLSTKRPCKKYDQEFKKVLSSEEFKKIDEENSDLYKYLSLHTGDNITNVNRLELLFSILLIEQINNLTLPEWTQSVFPDQMENLTALSLASFSYTDYMKKMKGGPFIKHVITLMKKKLHNEDVPKLHLYSAHDITLVHILRLLNLETIINPDFGAYLILELYSNDSDIIKVFYSNSWDKEPKERKLENCGTLCLFDTFLQNMNVSLPSDWDQECNN